MAAYEASPFRSRLRRADDTVREDWRTCPASAGTVAYFRGMSDTSAGWMPAPITSPWAMTRTTEFGSTARFAGNAGESVDCSGFLRVSGKNRETDLEGAASLTTAFSGSFAWRRIVTATSRRIGADCSRHRWLTNNGVPSLRPVERPYVNLLDDLGRDERYRGLRAGTGCLASP